MEHYTPLVSIKMSPLDPKIALSFPSYKYCEVPRVHPLKIKIDDDSKKHSPASFDKLQARALFPLPHCAKNDIFSGRILFWKCLIGYNKKISFKIGAEIKEKTQGAEFQILIVL